jgi:nicotinamide phosphoribosyltransferase
MKVLPVLLKDGYKVGHVYQYPADTTLVYSNMTPRRSRVEGVNEIVTFGMQYFIEEYLIRQFRDGFFNLPVDSVMKAYRRRIDNYLGPSGHTYKHIGELHELGYLPLHIKTLPEGSVVPMRVPFLTTCNTLPEFSWLTNMLETVMSNVLWLPSTSATTAHRYRKAFDRFAWETGADPAFCQWQGHDFSFRGIGGVEAALLSGAAHLLSFTGTDTIPAIDFLEEYYGADCEKELVGGSVPATEHSVMSMGGPGGELQTIRRLITEVVPTGIISIVCDTWDFWKVLTEYLPALRTEIMGRNGKVVVRPDSGDPVEIICGFAKDKRCAEAESVGAVETLWNTFGGNLNSQGYRELDPHVGLIYGDSITPERQLQILSGLKENGFASSNVVLGIGSYTYQHVTRDTYGFAMKATYGETKSRGGQAIYKQPKTDDGTKNSATGLLRVISTPEGSMACIENCTWEAEAGGLLRTTFNDGYAYNKETLAVIRQRLAAHREAAVTK